MKVLKLLQHNVSSTGIAEGWFLGDEEIHGEELLAYFKERELEARIKTLKELLPDISLGWDYEISRAELVALIEGRINKLKEELNV